jgi:hypothetical protein
MLMPNQTATDVDAKPDPEVTRSAAREAGHWKLQLVSKQTLLKN